MTRLKIPESIHQNGSLTATVAGLAAALALPPGGQTRLVRPGYSRRIDVVRQEGYLRVSSGADLLECVLDEDALRPVGGGAWPLSAGGDGTQVLYGTPGKLHWRRARAVVERPSTLLVSVEEFGAPSHYVGGIWAPHNPESTSRELAQIENISARPLDVNRYAFLLPLDG